MDMVNNGVTPIGFIAVMLLVLFMAGIVGALGQRPRQ